MTKNNADIRLASEKLPHLILSYSATTLASLLFYNLFTITDTLFVSRAVGSDAVGGISVVFPFVMFLSAVSTALGGGAASLISRRIGEGDYAAGGKIALNAMISFWITAAVTTVLGLLVMEPMLKAMGVTPEFYEYSKQYLTIILLGCVFSTGFSSIIRAEGKMKYALLIWVIPIAVNIVLDALFVFGFRWGVAGSAAATVACQFVSFCMSLLFFKKFSSLNFKGARPDIKILGEIITIGLPSLIQNISLAAAFVIMNNLLKWLGGTLAISVFAYVSKLLPFAIIPVTAIMQAISPIIGFNYGAGNSERTKTAVKTAVAITVIYGFSALAVLEVLPGVLLKLFGCEGEVLLQGTAALRITALALPFLPVAMITGTAYQAMGNKKKAIVMFAAIIVFMLPCAVIFIKIYGVTGLWWSFPAASVLSAGAAALIGVKIPQGKAPAK